MIASVDCADCGRTIRMQTKITNQYDAKGVGAELIVPSTWMAVYDTNELEVVCPKCRRARLEERAEEATKQRPHTNPRVVG